MDRFYDNEFRNDDAPSVFEVVVPQTTSITPQELMATVFGVLGIDPATQFINQAGRPVLMLDDGKPIGELI